MTYIKDQLACHEFVLYRSVRPGSWCVEFLSITLLTAWLQWASLSRRASSRGKELTGRELAGSKLVGSELATGEPADVIIAHGELTGSELKLRVVLARW